MVPPAGDAARSTSCRTSAAMRRRRCRRVAARHAQCHALQLIACLAPPPLSKAALLAHRQTAIVTAVLALVPCRAVRTTACRWFAHPDSWLLDASGDVIVRLAESTAEALPPGCVPWQPTICEWRCCRLRAPRLGSGFVAAPVFSALVTSTGMPLADFFY
eukprot:NODE_3382_length_794_cov_158.592693.p1 GENE.NODE_3382_length_794_cov_158.592693~~NODE_3382_length_794_cov_158.592693.p1  ORF type:complete len:160 (+),score=18.54 NODE_3382_length_794_cov_158.592693:115-594(+)